MLHLPLSMTAAFSPSPVWFGPMRRTVSGHLMGCGSAYVVGKPNVPPGHLRGTDLAEPVRYGEVAVTITARTEADIPGFGSLPADR